MGINQPTACKKQAGFTLVELAIVMIIIGLLIGGVLKGQELINNAQVTSAIAQLKATDAATTTFRDIYSFLPGDFAGVGRLPNCAGNCGTGNGDGLLPADPGSAVPALAAANEKTAFFSHMVAANLISGSLPTPTALVVGNSNPETPIQGTSMRVGDVAAAVPTGNLGGAITTWRQGHYLTVGSAVLGNAVLAAASSNNGLQPSQALRIDSKLDDGIPTTGSVRAGGVTFAAPNGCVNAAAVYNTQDVNSGCSLFIQIQG